MATLFIFISSFLLLPTIDARLPEHDPQNPMNIEVDTRQNRKESEKFTVMPASGSFAGNWRPINRRLDRLRVIRRSFPLNCRRYGKIVSARWIDGTTFHRLDSVTIPDFVDGEGMMVEEFRNPRFVVHSNRREGIVQVIWRKIREFLINL